MVQEAPHRSHQHHPGATRCGWFPGCDSLGPSGRDVFKSPTLGSQIEVGFLEIVIKLSTHKGKQPLPAPGPEHNLDSSRGTGVNANETPNRITRVGADLSLSDAQATPLA